WRPMRTPGLSAFDGFCGTNEIRLPRSARTSRSERASRSVPSTTTEPAAIRVPHRAWPRSAIATVVFPQPDSPTMPSAVPRGTSNDTSETMSVPVSPTSTRRPRTVRRASASTDGPLLLDPRGDPAPSAVAIDPEVDADRQEPEDHDRGDHRPGLDDDPRA